MWLKLDLYLRYCKEDLITPHYWSCSVLYILTNQIMTISAVLTFRSEYTTCLRWHENVTTKQLSSSSKYCISFETCIWLVEIMTHYANTKFIWTQTVMGGYQILYAIAKIEVRLSIIQKGQRVTGTCICTQINSCVTLTCIINVYKYTLNIEQ